MQYSLILGRDWLVAVQPVFDWAQACVLPPARADEKSSGASLAVKAEVQGREIDYDAEEVGAMEQKRCESAGFLAGNYSPEMVPQEPEKREVAHGNQGERDELHELGDATNKLMEEFEATVQPDRGSRAAASEEFIQESRHLGESRNESEEVNKEQTKSEILREFSGIFNEEGPQRHLPPNFCLQHELQLHEDAQPFAARPR